MLKVLKNCGWGRGRTRYLSSVAQVSNLLYRRFPIGRTSGSSRVHENSDDSQAGSPAIQQVGNLRYSSGGALTGYGTRPYQRGGDAFHRVPSFTHRYKAGRGADYTARPLTPALSPSEVPTSRDFSPRENLRQLMAQAILRSTL